MLEAIKALVREQDLCVLATVGEDKPHCSLMGYAVDEECREIYMATLKATRKFKNISANPSVSILIDDRRQADLPKALTVSGVFEPMEDQTAKDGVKAKLIRRRPDLAGLMGNEDAEIIRIKVYSFLLLQDPTTAGYIEL